MVEQLTQDSAAFLTPSSPQPGAGVGTGQGTGGSGTGEAGAAEGGSLAAVASTQDGATSMEVTEGTEGTGVDSAQKTGRPLPAGDVPLGCGQVDSEVEFRGLKGCKTSH